MTKARQHRPHEVIHNQGPETIHDFVDLDRDPFACDDEQVLDRVFASYEDMQDRLFNLTLLLDEERLLSWLKSHSDPEYEDHPEGMVIRLAAYECSDESQYPDVSKRTYKHFYNQGLQHNDFTSVFGLITSLNDPELAQLLLSSIEKDDAASKVALSQAKRSHRFGLWRDLLSDDTGVRRALYIGSMGLHSQLGAKKMLKSSVLKPLEEIAGLPPMPLQGLQRALQNRPSNLETQSVVTNNPAILGLKMAETIVQGIQGSRINIAKATVLAPVQE